MRWQDSGLSPLRKALGEGWQGWQGGKGATPRSRRFPFARVGGQQCGILSGYLSVLEAAHYATRLSSPEPESGPRGEVSGRSNTLSIRTPKASRTRVTRSTVIP